MGKTTQNTQSQRPEPAERNPQAIRPPRAKKVSQIRSVHGETFTDYYEWLRQKESPEVQAYVKAQNEYASARLTPGKNLASRLFDELKAHVEENDMSVPVRLFDYWYFSRTQEGEQYGITCRTPIKNQDDWDPPQIQTGENCRLPGEEVIFDANKEAQGHDFFRSGGMDLSDDGRWMLYLIDTHGNERYDCYVRDLKENEQLPDCIRGIGANACFTPDGQWIFYTRLDQAWRPCSIWRHHVGDDLSQDVEVYHEQDERFWCGVGLSFDESLIVIETASKTTSEVLFLESSHPLGEFSVFIPRADDIEYDVSFAKFENVREAVQAQARDLESDGQTEKAHKLLSLLPQVEVDADGSLPVAVVSHNVTDPNFEIDVINMKTEPAPYTLGQGVCIARGSDYGCEKGQADHKDLPVDTPYYDQINPQMLQGAQGLAIGGLGIYRNFVTLSYRSSGLPHIAVETKNRVLADYLLGQPWHFSELGGPDPQAVYSIGFTGNPSYNAPTVRYSYGSHVHPPRLCSYNPRSGQSTLLKAARVNNYTESDYAERRIWVRTRDGEKVPVFLTWKKGLVPVMDKASDDQGRPLGLGQTDYVLTAPSMEDAARRSAALWENQGHNVGSGAAEFSRTSRIGQTDKLHPAPMFITAYGSYGYCTDPGFGTSRLSFLDRGVVRVEIQIRGGGEMGRAWYEQGRRMNKNNSFFDFIDVTAALQACGWASPETTVANGGSAGGLLMGAVANLAPFLYAGIEADVPFVDALNSILDPSLPLTVTEWDEWGDPLHNKDVFDYMKAYTPYENVASGQERRAAFGTDHFPKIFITTSMNDTRVLYVEPLKWLSRLQEEEVSADAFARIEIEAGHGGVSGRYKAWEQISQENAWCLMVLGINQ